MEFSVSPVALSCLFFLFLITGTLAQDIGSIVTRDLFEQMLSFRNNDVCPGKGFYTYEAFITGANSFPAFGTTGDDTARKKEVAAFFGQTSHETNGGSAGTFTGGYCFVREGNQMGSGFYGRGPIQLTGQSNYERAGRGIGVGQDLVNNPDKVATDPVISFKTAIWFWMTAQDNKPSCHNVIIGRWTPSPADTSANRKPGYGVITNIINGGVECGKGRKDEVENRIGFYKRYCGMLNVPTGDNLDCYNQRNFSQG
ncbi:Acidic endochitinase Q [Capsicum annuum]|uniref:chitinase n=1 Tax=Capsicum annuum TaxID=4072 RepID=A0A1U8FME6_CAPAN|nr:Acidic endochitinase Q [Capsicum annuum]